jgi:hypothetical protein
MKSIENSTAFNETECIDAGGGFHPGDGGLCFMTPARCEEAEGEAESIEDTCGAQYNRNWAPLVENGISCDGTATEECLPDNMTDMLMMMMPDNMHYNEYSGLENCTQVSGLGLCVHPITEQECGTTCMKGGCDNRTVQARAAWYVSAGCCGAGDAVQSVCDTDSFVAPVPPVTIPTTTTTTTTPSPDVALQVEQHTISSSITLDVSEVGDLGNEASQTAMSEAIAESLGVSADDVEDVVMAIKVKGTMRMTVSDPEAFAASADAKLGIETAIANENEVDVSAVTATITVASSRRLLQAARRLSGGVNVEYEIEVQDGATADQMTASLRAADTSALAEAVNAQLTGSSLTVESIESISSDPEVSVDFSVVTEDADVAAAVETAVEVADPTAMTRTINAELEAAGIETEVSVSQIAAPEVSAETITQSPSDDASRDDNGSSTAMLSVGVMLLLVASANK